MKTDRRIPFAALCVSLSFMTLLAIADEKPTSLADARAAVETNMRTSEGKAYDQQLGKEFADRHLNDLRQCVRAPGADASTSFWVLLKLGKSGAVKEVLLAPSTKVGVCLRESLLKVSFSPPPRPDYWASIYLKGR